MGVMEPEKNSGELNDAQLQAVAVTTGPALVVAGAGTGKTRVIVERIMHLIDSGIAPESILALTFTEKAAGEMLERVNQHKTGVTLDTTISTFNGFGNDLLQTYGAEWGLGTLRLLGDTGQLVFLREHLDELELDYFAPISNPDGQLDILASYVSKLKQQLVKPAAYAAYAKTMPTNDAAEKLEQQKHTELAAFFQTYIDLCRTHQAIDYDDQIYLTIQLLEARPNILKALQSRFQYILVDEFQDTNPMQSRLIDLLAGTPQNVMVVGDDDQSIYGWRGATLANILDFSTRYPETKNITLIENYRSTQVILDSAYQLIQHNNPHRLEVMNELDKRLHGQTPGGKEPRVQHFGTFDAELAWVAEDISKRLAAGQDPSTIAVLTRRNQGVQKLHEALEQHDIPHVVAGMSNDIYGEPAVQHVLEALKAAVDPLNDVALFHVLSGPLCAVDIAILASIAALARREHQPLTDALSTSEDESVLAAMEQVTKWRQQAKDQSVGSLAYAILTDSGWKATLYEEAEHDMAALTAVQALSKLFKTFKEFERVAGVGSTHNYIVNLPALQAAGSGFEDASLDISDTLINVMSVHRAKGLEWDTVYIVDCTEGSFPLRKFGSGLEVPVALQANPSLADEHMSEERRLMYVAVTRARQELVLSYSDRHSSNTVRKPSRFIAELLGDALPPSIEASSEQQSLELFAPRAAANRTIPLPISMQGSDGRLVLSVSQIDCWLRCPQDFYYKYVLGMPLPPTPALEYGTLIHGMIEKLHKGRQENNVPSFESLRDQIVAGLPRAGYISVRSRERAHDQALKAAKTIYDRFVVADLPIQAETPFAVAVPGLELTIRGRVDAVYQTGNTVEIRDFKTGTSVTTPEKAKQRATSSNQLTLYALAWRELHGTMPGLLTLDFVETGQVGSVKKQPKSLDTLEDKLATMVTQLRNSTYPAGNDHSYCSHPLTI